MNRDRSEPRQNALVKFARTLGSSRLGSIIVALIVAALFCWLAYLAWLYRDLAAKILSLGLLIYGLEKAWRVLPITARTRERWKRDEQIGERCGACQFRSLGWFGFGLIIVQLWNRGLAALTPSELIGPGIFILVGLVCSFICRRFVRHAKAKELAVN